MDYIVTNDITKLPREAMQVWGQADDVDSFVRRLNIEERWRPWGYELRCIYYNGSKNMTAYLTKTR